jgi:fructose-1-phosphate kinase PfkB-like protein
MIYTLTLNPAIDRELTVEEIEYDKVLSALETRIDFGGKGFNVSRMLKSLGTSSVAVGFVGGNTGRRLQNGLHALGIDSDFVWVESETRTNISVVTQVHDHYLKVNEKGPLVDETKQDELLDKIDSIAQAGDWWVLAGSLPRGGRSFYARIIGCSMSDRPLPSWIRQEPCPGLPREAIPDQAGGKRPGSDGQAGRYAQVALAAANYEKWAHKM